MAGSRRKPHHSPAPGPFRAPEDGAPRLIRGELGIAGYGCAGFFVAVVDRWTAVETIRRRHYSGREVRNSYLHLGVFTGGALAGVLQFGDALMPAAMGRVVAGTGSTDYLELNRMWLDDAAPRNSESRAIAYAIRYIRATMPRVRWIQSFADERCGRWGGVYQAANFLYVGSHRTDFYELDGAFLRKMLLTAHKKAGQRGEHLRANLDRAVRHSFRQFRYVYFVHRGARRHLRLPVLPYPKPDRRSVIGHGPGTPRDEPGSIPGDRSTC